MSELALLQDQFQRALEQIVKLVAEVQLINDRVIRLEKIVEEIKPAATRTNK